ncbi:MAG: NifU family protein [Erysipelotrichaceae bacterium]|nr:NifU family protein [Erysipelotrichaceae bacterium]MBQ9987116.1 NifU family protein [Erysipelotrichales bacterium]MBR3693779.1 NifU family protein [Erysipelotrichales bacterium]
MDMNAKALEVKEVIEKIRPYLQHDGGDVEFVSLDEDGIVKVRMLGACMDCLAINETLEAGVEAIILEEVEGIKAVVLASPWE